MEIVQGCFSTLSIPREGTTKRYFKDNFLRDNITLNMASNNCMHNLAKKDNRNIVSYWNLYSEGKF